MTDPVLEACIDRAYDLHHSHYSCAQSVACSLCDLVGLDFDMAFDIMDGFGGGMGGFDQTCGAVSGGVAILGFARSDGSKACTSKKESYRICHELVERIKDSYDQGSALCKDLRPEDDSIVMAVCDGYIAKCVEITYNLLQENNLIKGC